jgi:hypothetical protein
MEPKPSKSRLQHQQQQEQTSEQQTTSQTKTHQEFDSVEDLLRYDISRTTPPPAVAERLRASLEAESSRKRSWIRRLFERKEAK